MRAKKKRFNIYMLLSAAAVFFAAVVFIASPVQESRQAAIFRYGYSGNAVRLIQERLQELGYYPGELDGIFGYGTYEAVRLFQQNNGLTPDGIVGESTLAALSISEEVNAANDLDVLSRAIYAEGRGEPYEGQVAIGAVVLNRVRSPNFPNTVPDVVFQTGAFDAVKDGQINLPPNDTAYSAARDALSGWDPTGGALYYWNPATATSRWIWSVPITYSIGNHVFGRK
ncbi:spore cortex-lytic enzyme [Lachnospiraceae bacterium NSJ-143]|nr:spore cortex-lytic enzyme [Lachnospiraceae bacterium NSJ-143]